jgi:hypothetical protein
MPNAKKAYDSVSHKFIESVLRKYGFHEEYINIVKILYNDIHTKVNVNGFLTDKIVIHRGVKQGDALSCALFILCMDSLMNKINNNSNIKPLIVNNEKIQKIVGYADDIAIITANKESINEVLKTYEEFSKVSGLYLNAHKTEIMNLETELLIVLVQTLMTYTGLYLPSFLVTTFCIKTISVYFFLKTIQRNFLLQRIQ